MALRTIEELATALTTAQRLYLAKNSITTVAGNASSFWAVGGVPGAGTAPGSVDGEIPTASTAGALPLADAATGKDLYLAHGWGSVLQAGLIFVYDRLWQNAFSMASSPQSITQPALTRATDGVGVELWVQNYTAVTGSIRVDATYTNTAAQGSRTATTSVNINTTANVITPLALQSGDLGVTSVQTVTLSVTGTGTCGLVLMKRVGQWSVPVAASGTQSNAFELGLRELPDGACLSPIYVASTTTSGVPLQLGLTVVDG